MTFKKSARTKILQSASLLIGFVVAGLPQHSVVAQSRDNAEIEKRFDLLIKESYRPSYMLELSGELASITNSQLHYNSPLPLIDILLDESVHNELAISDQQHSDLKRSKSKIEKAIDHTNQLFAQSVSKNIEVKTEAVDILESPIQEGFLIVEKTLLSVQAESLRKVFLVYRIRRLGLHTLLTSGELVSELEVTTAQKEKLKEAFKLLLTEQSQKLMDMKKEVVRRLLSELTKDQQDRFKSSVGEIEFLTQIPVSLFRHQLDRSTVVVMPLLEKESPWPEMLPLLYPSQFDIDLNAKLAIDFVDFEYVDPRIEIPERILHMFEYQSALAPKIALSSLQREEIQDIVSLKNLYANEYADARRERVDAFGWKGLNKDFREHWIERAGEQGDILLGKINDILLPRQKLFLEQLANRVGIQRMGLLFSLTRSSLGHDLEITTEQKEAIWKIAEKEKQRLEKQAVKSESEINRQLLSHLSEEQRQKFRALISDAIPIETGNLDIHLLLSQWYLRDSLNEFILPEFEAMDRFIGDDQ